MNRKRLILSGTTLLTLLCGALLPQVSARHDSGKEPLLPPLIEWHGNSEALIQDQNNPWQTFAEKSDLTETPNYQQTVSFIKRLAASDPRVQIESIGISPQGREIWMLVVSSGGANTAERLIGNKKPTLLVQAGIHSGEIDGKDAGLMLIRDIIHGNKTDLIDKVNLLFVPILSVDGHERISSANRVNQRGPNNMGWRTNALNLNLNRDYAKLDTIELRHMISAINRWQPDLYFDVHVTDGEDYQYDVTYGYNLSYAESPHIAQWFNKYFKSSVNKVLSDNGHLGGPLTFGMDSLDFAKGILGWTPSPRFSNGYGDVRHLPTVLIENHSLKPYKRRVLGTYVFIEQTMRLLANKGQLLKSAVVKDQTQEKPEMTLAWDVNKSAPESMNYQGVSFEQRHDEITGLDYIYWNGQPKLYKNLPIYVMNKATITVPIPNKIWIPPQYKDLVERLRIHGIKVKQLLQSSPIKVSQFKSINYKLSPSTFENRQMVTSDFEISEITTELPIYSYMIDTDQPLARLAVSLLDPRGPDSFFSWGFFNHIFQRTEYIESYAMIPLARSLFEKRPKLKLGFERKKKQNKKFAEDSQAQFNWLYSQSDYYDKTYLNYPILFQY